MATPLSTPAPVVYMTAFGALRSLLNAKLAIWRICSATSPAWHMIFDCLGSLAGVPSCTRLWVGTGPHSRVVG